MTGIETGPGVVGPHDKSKIAPGVGAGARAWWLAYCRPDGGDPGTRARLRRARSIVDAAVIPAAIVLARRLGALKGETRSGGARFERALNLARVLAHVTSDDTQRPMRAAGWKSLPKDSPSGVVGDAERPRLSEQRFRRLLSTESGEDQVQAFVRLIGLLDDKVNIASVSEDFWFWSDRTKRAWAFDYYAAGIAAPAEGPSTAEESA